VESPLLLRYVHFILFDLNICEYGIMDVVDQYYGCLLFIKWNIEARRTEKLRAIDLILKVDCTKITGKVSH
jgi:hypothetical protein